MPLACPQPTIQLGRQSTRAFCKKLQKSSAWSHVRWGAEHGMSPAASPDPSSDSGLSWALKKCRSSLGGLPGGGHMLICGSGGMGGIWMFQRDGHDAGLTNLRAWGGGCGFSSLAAPPGLGTFPVGGGAWPGEVRALEIPHPHLDGGPDLGPLVPRVTRGQVLPWLCRRRVRSPAL